MQRPSEQTDFSVATYGAFLQKCQQVVNSEYMKLIEKLWDLIPAELFTFRDRQWQSLLGGFTEFINTLYSKTENTPVNAPALSMYFYKNHKPLVASCLTQRSKKHFVSDHGFDSVEDMAAKLKGLKRVWRDNIWVDVEVVNQGSDDEAVRIGCRLILG